MARRKADVFRNKWIGILFILLMIFSLILSVETPYSASLGDILLKHIKLMAWENGDGGFHYTILYTFALFIIGYAGAVHFLKDIYPRLVNKIPLLTVLLLILMPSMYTIGNKAIMTLSNGVNAVYFQKELSSCELKSDDHGHIIFDSQLQFHNYSNKDVTFHIKLIPNMSYQKDLFKEDKITAIDPLTGKPKAFTLHPKETAKLQVSFVTTANAGITGLHGGIDPASIIIFNEKDEKRFIKRYP